MFVGLYPTILVQFKTNAPVRVMLGRQGNEGDFAQDPPGNGQYSGGCGAKQGIFDGIDHGSLRIVLRVMETKAG